MSVESRLTNFLARNKDYKRSHVAPSTIPEMQAKGPSPHGALVIISCYDPRVRPEAFLGIKPGEASVYANAGGRVNADTIRSLAVLDLVAGIDAVIVVHHTDCGLTHITDATVKERLKERAPEHAQSIERAEYGEIRDLKQSIKEDMAIISASPFLKPGTKVWGYLFDLIGDGGVEEVKID